MNRTWAETKMQLDGLRQEYRVLCHEMRVTTDYDHAKHLATMASTCVLEFLAILRQHHYDPAEEYTTQIAARRAFLDDTRPSRS